MNYDKNWTDYQKFIFLSRYAKWNEEIKRRETWIETVDRYINFFSARFPDVFPSDLLRESILELKVVPSMRALMTAGEALDRDNVAGYNCSYVAIDHPRAFDELMYILMCGTGVGFSVEEKYVRQLPTIAEELHETATTIIIADSRIGWASGFRELLSLLYSGKIPKWDLSRVRKAGARLRTFGGRASGPEPLDRLFKTTVVLFKEAAGRQLTSLECHDLVCRIADVVIVGGVRRSALISLSDLGDISMAKAKNGQWWVDSPERALANISAVYSKKPDFNVFLDEWKNLYESKSGERGVFNLQAIREQLSHNNRRESDGREFGTNPCGEIILRSCGFCNLTEVIVRPTDDYKSLRSKVELAAVLGTFQSTLTDFRYLRRVWKNNADEERLLGVSLTGIFDNSDLRGTSERLINDLLGDLKNVAIETNKEWAARLGIPQSVAVTCVKPSGTVSQLAGCSSGIHPAFSKFYYRTVRLDSKDPLYSFLQASGVRIEPEKFHSGLQGVVYFPCKAADGAAISEGVTAKDHFNLYLKYRRHWCEHNPSTTIYYSDDEFFELGDLVWNNWNDIGGIAFLPRTDHVYDQAPYIPITEEEYNKAVSEFPKIDWGKFYEFEKEDQTTNQHDLACSAGMCEL